LSPRLAARSHGVYTFFGEFKLSIKLGELIKGTEIKLTDGKVQVAGVLAKEDPTGFRRGSVCKVSTIKLSAGKSYQIDMMSQKIDAYLRLEDATGKQLARDDDSGDGRIVFNCPVDGTCRVVATTFRGDTGAFTLKINQK
jgi:hypothetical protein